MVADSQKSTGTCTKANYKMNEPYHPDHEAEAHTKDRNVGCLFFLIYLALSGLLILWKVCEWLAGW
jgi:hypothetical protein